MSIRIVYIHFDYGTNIQLQRFKKCCLVFVVRSTGLKGVPFYFYFILLSFFGSISMLHLAFDKDISKCIDTDPHVFPFVLHKCQEMWHVMKQRPMR